MGKSLNESLSYFKDIISDLVESEKNISIISHLDCDGLTSASIIGKALFREGLRCTIGTTNEFNNNLIDRLELNSVNQLSNNIFVNNCFIRSFNSRIHIFYYKRIWH